MHFRYVIHPYLLCSPETSSIAPQFTVIASANFFVNFVGYFIFAWTAVPLAFLISTFTSKASTASTICFLIFVLGFFIQIIFAGFSIYFWYDFTTAHPKSLYLNIAVGTNLRLPRQFTWCLRSSTLHSTLPSSSRTWTLSLRRHPQPLWATFTLGRTFLARWLFSHLKRTHRVPFLFKLPLKACTSCWPTLESIYCWLFISTKCSRQRTRSPSHFTFPSFRDIGERPSIVAAITAWRARRKLTR